MIFWKRFAGCAKGRLPDLITTCIGWLCTCKKLRPNMEIFS